jgi:hypothetical protein
MTGCWIGDWEAQSQAGAARLGRAGVQPVSGEVLRQ